MGKLIVSLFQAIDEYSAYQLPFLFSKLPPSKAVAFTEKYYIFLYMMRNHKQGRVQYAFTVMDFRFHGNDIMCRNDILANCHCNSKLNTND